MGGGGTTDAGMRYRRIQAALAVTLFLNMLVAGAKFLYGTLTGSVAMRADGIASIFDGLSNVVGIVGMSVATRPADDDHPYGHAKFETYASVVIGVMLVLAARNVFVDAMAGFMGQAEPPRVTPVSYVVMLGTLAVNLGVSAYERRLGRELSSEVLSADSEHTLSDALVSLSVIASLALVQLGFPLADPICSLLVAVAIARSAWLVFRQASQTLSDRARIPREQVEQVVLGVPGVRSCHRIRTRGTEGEVYADLHILVDPEMPTRASHALSQQVEQAVGAAFPQVAEVIVHVEPDLAEERAEA